jgi:hypothetical protein
MYLVNSTCLVIPELDKGIKGKRVQQNYEESVDWRPRTPIWVVVKVGAIRLERDGGREATFYIEQMRYVVAAGF